MNLRYMLAPMLIALLGAAVAPAYADHAQATISIVSETQTVSPDTVTLDVGGEATWSNDGSSFITIKSRTHGAGDGSVFNSGALAPGETYSFIFDRAGSYDFFSELHRDLTGTILVEDPDSHAHDSTQESDMHGNAVNGEYDASMGHAHGPLESEVPVSVNIAVTEHDGSVDVHIMTEGWTWAPENVNTDHVPGEGHAHIYVDGEKINRVYGSYHNIKGLEPGERHIRVTLNANTHNDLTVDGVLVEDSAMVTVTAKQAHHNAEPVDGTSEMSIWAVAHEDLLSGYNLQVVTEGFVLSPENVDTDHIQGQGHIHVSIDGKEHARMYTSWLKIPKLDSGMHTITVGLYSNLHGVYYWNGEPIEDSITVHVVDAHDDAMEHGMIGSMESHDMEPHDDTHEKDMAHDDATDHMTDSMESHDMDIALPSTAPSAQGMLSDGTMVNIWSTEPRAGERMEITMEFEEAKHVNHDLIVTQKGETVLADEGAHHHNGIGVHKTAPLPSSDPVDITIVFTGYGMSEPLTGPIGEEVVMLNVTPEFDTIAIIILGVAVLSMVILGTRSATLRI